MPSSSQITITSRAITHFKERIHKHLTELVSEEQELLSGWMDSDRRRSKANAERLSEMEIKWTYESTSVS